MASSLIGHYFLLVRVTLCYNSYPTWVQGSRSASYKASTSYSYELELATLVVYLRIQGTLTLLTSTVQCMKLHWWGVRSAFCGCGRRLDAGGGGSVGWPRHGAVRLSLPKAASEWQVRYAYADWPVCSVRNAVGGLPARIFVMNVTTETRRNL